MATDFTNINDLLKKTNNEEATEEIESSGVPTNECLTADEFVNQIVTPIQELQSDAKKTVKTVKFNNVSYEPDENGVVSFKMEGKMPTVQTSANGTNKNYIYSTNDSESTYTVLSGKIWMYTHTDRNLFLRFKNWGAENDTNATNYNQVLLCYLVNKNRDGLMDKYVFARILNNYLAEGLNTTDKVIVNYTNFAESGNKQLELTKATTAKAGVMTAAQVTALNKASADIQTLVGRITALEKKVAALEAK
jgi:hypothetical protein